MREGICGFGFGLFLISLMLSLYAARNMRDLVSPIVERKLLFSRIVELEEDLKSERRLQYFCNEILHCRG